MRQFAVMRSLHILGVITMMPSTAYHPTLFLLTLVPHGATFSIVDRVDHGIAFTSSGTTK